MLSRDIGGEEPIDDVVEDGLGRASQRIAVSAAARTVSHQAVARGGFVTGALVPPLQTLSSREIAEAVRIGPYLMPRFSPRQISDADLNSIIKYVQWTNRPDNHGGWGIGNIGPIPEGLIAWWIGAPLLLIACFLIGRRFIRS